MILKFLKREKNQTMLTDSQHKDIPKWKDDLIKDIRFGDHRDHVDDYRPIYGGTSDHLKTAHNVDENIIGGSFSLCNRIKLLDKLKGMGNSCKCIVEIGVDRIDDLQKVTSTSVILNNKPADCFYFGIDILDKSYLADFSKNIHFLQTSSSNTNFILNYIKQCGHTAIDFLFIDGFHSIEQVYSDWELTKMLHPNGIVGFHDTAYHPGPNLFLRNLNKKTWHTEENLCQSDINDYGIGFAWKNN